MALTKIEKSNVADDAINIAQLGATGTADATTFLRGDNSWVSAGGENTPYFYAYLVTDVTAVSDLTWTKVPCNTVGFQTGSTYDNSTNYRWTPAVAGKYSLYGQVQCRADSNARLGYTAISIYKNGSDAVHTVMDQQNDYTWTITTTTISAILDLDDDDYVELWALIDTYSGNRRFYGAYQATHFMGYKLID